MVGFGVRLVTREIVAQYQVTITASPEGSYSRDISTTSLGYEDFPYASGGGAGYADISLEYKGGNSRAPQALVVRTRDLGFYATLPLNQKVGLKFYIAGNDFQGVLNGYGSLYFIDVMRDGDPGPNYNFESIVNCTIYLYAKNDVGTYVNNALTNNAITANTGNPKVSLTVSEILRLAANKYLLGALLPGKFALYQGSNLIEAVFIVSSTKADPGEEGAVISYYIPKTGKTDILSTTITSVQGVSVSTKTVYPLLRFYLLSPGQYSVQIFDSGKQFQAYTDYKRKQWEQQIADANKVLDLIQKGANIAKTVTEAAKNATDVVGNIAKLAGV